MEEIGPEAIGTAPVENVDIIKKTKHLCWLYESEADRLAVVAPFVVAALARRRQCLLVVPESVREEIYLELSQGDVNVSRYAETGQIIHVEPEEMLFGGGAFDIDVVMHRLAEAFDATEAQGWEGLAVVTDASEMLERVGDDDWLALEFQADYVCSTRPCMMLCLYDQRRISAKLLASMIKAHPVIGLGSALAKNPFYAEPAMKTS